MSFNSFYAIVAIRKLCPAIERVVERRIIERHPRPAIFTLKSGSPQERMAFSRLNPSHTDTHDRIQEVLPLLSNFTKSALDNMIEYLPYTDQKSYVRYMLSMAPNFAMSLFKLLSQQEYGEDYLMERGRVYPTISEGKMDRGMDNIPPPPSSEPPPRTMVSSNSDTPSLTSKYPPPPLPPISSQQAAGVNNTYYPPPPLNQ